MDKNQIIERISIARTNANLSARALSQKIGMNSGYINRLESKKDFLPRLETLLDIIEVCGMTTEQFFYEDFNSYQTDKALLANLKNMKTEKKEALLKFLNY
ncbi:MAG: helix-turn-helix transcriptional regulator [Clostridia bacterium]|nr:helix-turn-helix transcriptional regulator [Clostridia bacterium]